MQLLVCVCVCVHVCVYVRVRVCACARVCVLVRAFYSTAVLAPCNCLVYFFMIFFFLSSFLTHDDALA